MEDSALSIESLSLSIRGRPVLRDISARLGAGGCLSLIGPNGAGKSTLLRCLMRIHGDWTGRLLLDGVDAKGMTQRELARRMAYVPQPGGDAGFHFTVREFVGMGRYAWAGAIGQGRPGDAAAVENAMRRAKVACFADRTMDMLSGGERQKVFIAAAMAQGSDVLLLDEPAAFLDYRHQADVAAIVDELRREQGTAVLNVTHDVNSALLAGGDVLALCRGAVAWRGPASELACGRTLARIFGGHFRFVEDPSTGMRLVVPPRMRNS